MTANTNHSLSFKEDKLQVTKKKVTSTLLKTSEPKLESESLNKQLAVLPLKVIRIETMASRL